MLSPPPQNEARLSALAVTSLVLGLLGATASVSPVFGVTGLPFSSFLLWCLPAAAVLGSAALIRINRAPSALRGKAMAIVGFTVGLIGTIALATLRIMFMNYDGR